MGGEILERIETTLIDFHLDVCDIATNMEGLSKVLEKVEKETNGIMNYMTRVFDNVLKSVEKTIH